MIQRYLLQLYAQLYLTRRPVHIAESDAERDGIYRLRYEVYAQEQNAQSLLSRYPDGAIETDEDHAENAILFYLGPPERPKATGRAMLYKPGELPQQLYDKYSLHRFPDIHDRAVFEVNFFAARKDQRGGAAIVSLLSGAARVMVERHGAEVLIGDCVPALLTPYRRLGLRTYGGELIAFEGGLLVPVVGILGDVEAFRRVGSPVYPALKRLADSGALRTEGLEPLLQAVDEHSPEEIAAQIIEEVEACAQAHPSPFLRNLSPDIIRRLAAYGLAFDVHVGQELIREEFSDQEMFLVLSGQFEILQGDEVLRVIGPGALFGEIAFFSKRQLRSATVRCASPARVLLIRRSFIDRLKRSSPDDAFLFYEALAAVMAERFIE